MKCIIIIITCFKCKRRIAGHTKQIFVHLRAVHHINSSATYFQCCEQGCGRTFSFIRSFRRHLIKHEGEHDLIEVPEDDPNATISNKNSCLALLPSKALKPRISRWEYFSNCGSFIQPLEQKLPVLSYVQQRDTDSGCVRQVAVTDISAHSLDTTFEYDTYFARSAQGHCVMAAEKG